MATYAASFVMMMIGDPTKYLDIKGKDNGLITIDMGVRSNGNDGVTLDDVFPYASTRANIENGMNSA